MLINNKSFFIYKGSVSVQYISTVDTTPPAQQGQSQQLLDYGRCVQTCGQNFTILCFGFSFNLATNSCIHYYDFDYDLGPVGGSPGVDHYRRIFQSGKYNNSS